MQRDSDPTPNELQRALLEYSPTDLEEALIEWTREHWPMAARAMVYNKTEGDNMVSGVQGVRFEQALLQAAKERQQADEAQMESDYLALKPLEQAVLWRLLEMGQRFRPYDAEALRFYREKASAKATPQQAQNALESLRNRYPALVWKSARGEYAVDDAAMHRWFQQRVQGGTWPPVDPQGRLAGGGDM